MTPHLAIFPIVAPIVVAAALLLFDSRRLALKRALALATALALVVVALLLFRQVTGAGSGIPGPEIYRLGDWPVPFGIVLVVDRLSAVMLLLAAFLGLAALVYATARWDRVQPRFYSLFLLLLAGIDGVLLTGDLFNLYVFIEVLLVASYGLALHGGGAARLRAGLHYVAINVVASLLLLVGIALLYAVTGALNLAAIATILPKAAIEDPLLLRLALLFLGVGFMVKAAVWPLGFWLARSYGVAVPPVAAQFAILTKVGIYIILRLHALFLGAAGGDLAVFSDRLLILFGCLTVLYGALGILATKRLSRVAGHYLLVSSGTLLAGIGFGGAAIVAALLYYLVSATLAVAAFYLMTELVRRHRYGDERGDQTEPVFADEDTGAIDERESETGTVIPGTLALLGGGFIFSTLLLSGLPPLSGFVGKFAIIDALLRAGPAGIAGHAGPLAAFSWLLIALVLVAGLATLVSLTRAGIDLLWTSDEGAAASRLRLAEVAAIGGLLALSAGLTIMAGPAYRVFEDTAATIMNPVLYIDAVLGVGAGMPGGA